MRTSEKIRPEHLARAALVYVRQSTIDQVRHHAESRRRQYDLAEHTRALGWNQVVVIDEDLGKSGASAAGRPGFQRLVAEVSLGRAGAVVGLEVSRLARNNRDWYQLLDLCGLMNTLIVDAEGVYDPRQLNDRLLLGLKGTMSEAELGWIRQRAHEGLLAKARRGELFLNLPVGYILTRDERVEKHPDQRVQDGVALVFQKFTELGSVRQVLFWFRHEQLSVPAVAREAPWGERVTWCPPCYSRLLRLLQNPFYAGAYAFGRTETRTRVVNGAPRLSHGHRRQPDRWIALLRDHHESYIPWETYERNQQLIAENTQLRGAMARGAVRRGQSLIAGLLRCGRCGRRMYVSYSGDHAQVPRYSCLGAEIIHGARRCISFGGRRVDQAIEHELLRVLRPAAIEAALATAERSAEETAATSRALDLELREARYEADRAQRQYDAVEPEHRLVAETLERRWNQALERVRKLEARLEALSAEQGRLTVPDRPTLLALAEQFPTVWNDPATDVRTKKRCVRLLIEEIVARLPEDGVTELLIHWKGGKHTMLRVPRNRTGQHGRCTSRDVIAVVRDLARSLPDGQIARVLNRLGYRTGAGNTWTQTRIRGLRHNHGIAVFDPTTEGEGAALTIAQAAKKLGVSHPVVHRMIKAGILSATQPVPYAPWAIQQDALMAEAVQRAVDAVKPGRALPRNEPEAQLTLAESRT
jgi:DNA invertase Pin-like site-specific DNA recombinase